MPPQIPNFVPGVGALATDRFDFQKHLDGTAFRHKANTIDLLHSLVIGGTTVTTVQDSIVTLNNTINTLTIPPSTASTLGLVQLSSSGDVQGTATQMRVVNIQGIPISPVVPTNGQFLKFNGTSWIPGSQTVFSAGGDLSGTSTSQTVIGMGFGLSLSSTIAMHVSNLTWDNGITFPLINQLQASPGVNGGTLFIQAQAGNASNGGNVIINGGFASPGNIIGGVSLQTGDGVYGVQYTTVSTNNLKVLSLVNNNVNQGLTSTQMPAGTGSQVIFIGDTTNPPTSGLPTGGTILYSKSGALNVLQPDGTSFVVGQKTPQFKWGTLGILSSPAAPSPTVGSVEFQMFLEYQSTGLAIQNFAIGLPTSSSAYVFATFVGRSITTPGNSGFFNLMWAFSVDSSGNTTSVGSQTTIDSRTLGTANGWTAPSIAVGSIIPGPAGSFVVSTGHSSSGGENIDWSITVRVITAK